MTPPLALIIEDDERLANIFSIALHAAGFETETARDGKAALLRLAEIHPTLILLDLHLPYISGQTILFHIRTDSRLKEVPVILATADAIMGESLRGEADLVLLKPISVIQLRDLAQRLISPPSPS